MKLADRHARALTRVAAHLELEDRHSDDPRVRALVDFRPEDAVALATDLLAQGIDTPSVVGLASLPSDVGDLSRSEVEPLARSMLTELDVPLPPADMAAWLVTESLARSIKAGSTAAGPGADQLWHLWSEMDAGPPVQQVAEMLPLAEAWEESAGSRRLELEDEIRSQAEKVIIAAEAKLASASGFEEPDPQRR